MAEAWNIEVNEKINNTLDALDNKVKDWATANIENPVYGFADKLNSKIQKVQRNCRSFHKAHHSIS